MSLSEEGGESSKFQFKGRFGVASAAIPSEEPTHEEIDRFVKNILGLDNDKEE